MQQHWIYVLGSPELRQQASLWQQRKSGQGKRYEVIETGAEEAPAGRLAHVGNEDVLYVYARMQTNGIGETAKNPPELARHLSAEGLDSGHKVVKIFASGSGDAPSGEAGRSYAERLYEAMKETHPNIVVYGYHGDLTPQGYSLHKTAGLSPGESLDEIPEEAWKRRGLRASENRVRFPPET
jgi:hypothetical protein